MFIAELEDLQIQMLDELPDLFKGNKDILEEDLIARVTVEVSSIASQMVKSFHGNRADPEVISKNLHEILRWSTLAAYVLEVECPLYEDLLDESVEWEPEVQQCGILASVMLQKRLSDLTLRYYLQAGNTESDTQIVWDIFSLVNVLAERCGQTLRDVLVSK